MIKRFNHTGDSRSLNIKNLLRNQKQLPTTGFSGGRTRGGSLVQVAYYSSVRERSIKMSKKYKEFDPSNSYSGTREEYFNDKLPEIGARVKQLRFG